MIVLFVLFAHREMSPIKHMTNIICFLFLLGKRPLSSMCPAVFVDTKGDVRFIVGAAGGTKISSGVAWVSLRKLWLGDNVKEAVDARRIHHQLYPMTFQYEDGTLTVSRYKMDSPVSMLTDCC